MTKWAFELSEEIRNLVMIRSVTRLSHASGNVTLGSLPEVAPEARYKHKGPFLDTDEGPMTTVSGPLPACPDAAKTQAGGDAFRGKPLQ